MEDEDEDDEESTENASAGKSRPAMAPSKTYNASLIDGSIRDICDSIEQIKGGSVLMRPTMDAKGDIIPRSICGSLTMLEKPGKNREKVQDYMQIKQMLMKHK